MFDEAAAEELLAVVRLRVKRLREEQNLSQEEAAARGSTDVRTIQRFEAADFPTRDPRIRSFLKVSLAYGCEPHKLFLPPTDEEREAIRAERDEQLKRRH